MRTCEELRNIEDIPFAELDTYLAKFLVEAKKKDKHEYEPSTLSSISHSIQEYLKEHNKFVIFNESKHFRCLQGALAAKWKQLKSQSYGNGLNAARELDTNEIDLLYQKGLFGHTDPLTIERMLWLHIALHCGWRARDESVKLKWGDFELQMNVKTPVTTGEEMLVFVRD